MGQMVKGSGKQWWGERGFWRTLVGDTRNPSQRQWLWDTMDTEVLTLSMFCSAVALVRKSCHEKVINRPVLQATLFYPLLPSPRDVMCPAAGRLLWDSHVHVPTVKRAHWLSRHGTALGKVRDAPSTAPQTPGQVSPAQQSRAGDPRCVHVGLARWKGTHEFGQDSTQVRMLQLGRVL